MFYDKKPTLASWPYEIKSFNELNDSLKKQINKINHIDSYKWIYFSVNNSLVGYGLKQLYKITSDDIVMIQLQDIIKIETTKELLQASMIVYTNNQQIKMDYVTSTYYIFDPLLDYLCSNDYDIYELEKLNPRSNDLFKQSMCMYNYALYAYRLGKDVSNYKYRYENKREIWMPWKINRKEWLTIDVDGKIYQCYSYKYLIQCVYILKDVE